MISFQHIPSGEYLASRSDFSLTRLLADAYPFHQIDEPTMRDRYPALREFRTVTYSSRIDHPANDLSRLTPEQLAERYPIYPPIPATK